MASGLLEGVFVRMRIAIMLAGALCGAIAGVLTKLWFAG